METKKTYYEVLSKINVSKKTEKKGRFTYLSWADAWDEVLKVYPNISYEIKTFGANNLPYLHDPNTGYMVFTKITIENITRDMWLPVMNSGNKALIKASMCDINKTIMRCLVKNLAMFGFALYIYRGEDFPEDDCEKTVQKTTNSNYKKEIVYATKENDKYSTEKALLEQAKRELLNKLSKKCKDTKEKIDYIEFIINKRTIDNIDECMKVENRLKEDAKEKETLPDWDNLGAEVKAKNEKEMADVKSKDKEPFDAQLCIDRDIIKNMPAVISLKEITGLTEKEFSELESQSKINGRGFGDKSELSPIIQMTSEQADERDRKELTDLSEGGNICN